MSFDSILGVHEQALHLRALRSEVLASNIANADTPGYQARDIDFTEALSQAMAGESAPNRLDLNESPSLKYRIPLQSALDGNTVETDREQAAFADNTVRYQATLQFLGGKFSSLKSAITGGR